MPIEARGRCCRVQVRVIGTSKSESSLVENGHGNEAVWSNSTPIQGMFSRCGVCGQCTCQNYEWVTNKYENISDKSAHDKVLCPKVIGENALHLSDGQRMKLPPKEIQNSRKSLISSPTFQSQPVAKRDDRSSFLKFKEVNIYKPEKDDHVPGHISAPAGRKTYQNNGVVEDSKAKIRRRIAAVLRQGLHIRLCEKRAGMKPGESRARVAVSDDRHVIQAAKLRHAAMNSSVWAGHRSMFKLLDIHERILLHPSSSSSFLGRWYGDVAMRSMIYSSQQFTEMQEAGMSFWPESLLTMIIEVYLIDQEPGVYLLQRGVDGNIAVVEDALNERVSGPEHYASYAVVHGGNKVFSLLPDPEGVKHDMKLRLKSQGEQGWVQQNQRSILQQEATTSDGIDFENGGPNDSDPPNESKGSASDSDNSTDHAIGCTGKLQTDGACYIS